jgi:oligopeptide transport system permease protein
MLNPAIPPEYFQPLQQRLGEDTIARPNISYWQHVWRRFRHNKMALGALFVALSLLLFAVAGPWLWPVDASAQSIGSRSLGPSLSRSAQLVAWQPWSPTADRWQVAMADAGDEIAVLEANTEFVRLVWRPIAGAVRYAVYRNAQPDRAAKSLGLPLEDLPASDMPWLEDRLDLREIDYRYSILAYDARGDVLQQLTLELAPDLAIGLMDAQLQNLVSLDLGPGDLRDNRVTLPAHPLGTDHLGRDILARLMHGGRVSLFIGVAAPLFYVLFGALYGGVAAYLGGRIDDVMMRFADFVVALPFLLFMILFRVLFGIQPGESGITAMLVAMIVLGWPSTARLVRGQVLQLKGLAFVNAARTLGGRPMYIIFTHMLPNVMGVLLVSLTFAIPSAIFTEAFLSFIGLGVAPPAPSWGSMCNDGIRTMLAHPHELLFPAVAISLTVLAFNLLGDALRDAFDIRLREGVGNA